jgi:hypothetical protein
MQVLWAPGCQATRAVLCLGWMRVAQQDLKDELVRASVAGLELNVIAESLST